MDTRSYTINGKEGNTTLIAKMTREQLSKEFPECKFSVTSKYFSGGSEISIALMEAPFDVFADNLVYSQVWGTEEATEKGYAQLNHYQIGQDYDYQKGISNGRKLTREAWKVLARAVEIGQAQNWDNSEPQTDYFDVNYYFHLAIGKWNKDFTKTETKPARSSPNTPTTDESSAAGWSITHDRDWTWVFFPAKPAPEILEGLKSAGARWSHKKSGWYFTRHIESADLAFLSTPEPTPEPVKVKPSRYALMFED